MPRVALRAIALAIVLTVLGAVPANAHAGLVGTEPSAKATLSSAPETVSMTFSENVGSAFVAVTAPDGSSIKTTDVTAVDRTVTAAVADVGMRGRFSVSFRVVSADSHPVDGTFTYTVTTGRTVEQVDTATVSESFVQRHEAHLLWGAVAVIVAVGLIVAPLRRSRD